MSCANVEFLAEDEHVEIVPNFTHEKLYLISGNVGPFEAGIVVSVPLWLALYFKQRQKCQVVVPSWMNVDELERLKALETSQNLFVEMPSQHYMEIARALIMNAPSDIPRADEIKTLIKDIWDIRMAKLRTSISIFVSEERPQALVNNLTQLELCQVRQFFTSSLNHIHSLQSALDDVDFNAPTFSQ